MNTYHKIQTVFLRDPATQHKTLLEGVYAKPDFEYLAYNEWQCTEKIDGTNIRVMWDGINVSYNGKTDNAQIHADLMRHLYEEFTAEKMTAQFGSDSGFELYKPICLYGEGYGAGIQSGGYYRQDKAFILFDVKVGDTWLERPNVEDVAAGMECPIVPILFTLTLPEAVEKVRKGFFAASAREDHTAEGLVMRPTSELFNRFGERVITKLKYKDFPR